MLLLLREGTRTSRETRAISALLTRFTCGKMGARSPGSAAFVELCRWLGFWGCGDIDSKTLRA